jgi:hypothetical protein
MTGAWASICDAARAAGASVEAAALSAAKHSHKAQAIAGAALDEEENEVRSEKRNRLDVCIVPSLLDRAGRCRAVQR